MGKGLYFFPVKFCSQSASFRVPEEHTFQSTLPLPPITALKGLVGAAMGLGFEDAMAFSKAKGLSFGVYGGSTGFARDLWKHQKIKSGEVVSSVLTRDLLFNFNLDLLIVGNEKEVLNAVRTAFLDPHYVLTMGTSDDIAKILSVGEVDKPKIISVDVVEKTCLRGNYLDRDLISLDIRTVPLNSIIRPPRVYILPTEYSFENEERRLCKKEPFTFVEHSVELAEPVQGVEYEGKEIPLL